MKELLVTIGYGLAGVALAGAFAGLAFLLSKVVG